MIDKEVPAGKRRLSRSGAAFAPLGRFAVDGRHPIKRLHRGNRAAWRGDPPKRFLSSGWTILGRRLRRRAFDLHGNKENWRQHQWCAVQGMAWKSSHGLVSIDPGTREMVQDVYIRRVERVDGELYNVEFENFPAVKGSVKREQGR